MRESAAGQRTGLLESFHILRTRCKVGHRLHKRRAGLLVVVKHCPSLAHIDFRKNQERQLSNRREKEANTNTTPQSKTKHSFKNIVNKRLEQLILPKKITNKMPSLRINGAGGSRKSRKGKSSGPWRICFCDMFVAKE